MYQKSVRTLGFFREDARRNGVHCVRGHSFRLDPIDFRMSRRVDDDVRLYCTYHFTYRIRTLEIERLAARRDHFTDLREQLCEMPAHLSGCAGDQYFHWKKCAI